MSTALGIIGMIGAIVSLVLLVIRVIKKKPKKLPLIALVVCLVLFIVGAATSPNGDSDTPKTSEASETTDNSSQDDNTKEEASKGEEKENRAVYTDAEIVDLMNGLGTSKVGTMSVSKADQSDCTEEAIADWFFNYVKKNSDCNYHVIVYNDNPEKGVYTIGGQFGMIQKDISLTKNGDGTYAVGDDAGSTIYLVNEDNKTITLYKVMADESVVQNVREKIDAIIPEKYKAGKMYSVDVAGEEGNLDCNLTLINSDFSTTDCQGIAVEIADKIKEMDLGVGYFCIAFQTDDYNLNALSSIDSLSSQDASEITTQTY